MTMKTLISFIACFLLVFTTAFAQQASVTGRIPQYANGSLLEVNGTQIISNTSINQTGYFSASISSTSVHTFTVSPVAGSPYASFSVTVTVSTSSATDISSTLIASIPPPTPTPFPSINVMTPYVTIDSITYTWPSTQGSGCLSNDGSGNFSWIACSSTGTVEPAHTVYSNSTASSAAPTFTATPVFSAATLTGFPTFNQSTTGNAATATRFQGTPTLCSAGQVPTGVGVNGNAVGCAAPVGFTLSAVMAIAVAGAGTQNVTITGVTVNSRCTFSPASASAGTNDVGVYVGTPTANTVPIVLPTIATVNDIYNIVCSNNI